jgi:putative ABC transport system ATP-binding protein
MNDIHIRLESVTKEYPGPAGARAVLQDVSADIPRGQFAVLVGRSGSGKSTLLNLVGCLDHPTRGRVLLDGQDVAGLSETELALLRRHRIGFVFQFFNLIPTLTALENVLLPLELTDQSGSRARRQAADWLRRVGLGDRPEAFPEELSGGEQQRVAVARALVHQPGLLVADEPTGNLDLDTAQSVLDLMDDLCRREGATLVMATHSPEVVGIADRVFSIRDGHLTDEPLPAASG